MRSVAGTSALLVFGFVGAAYAADRDAVIRQCYAEYVQQWQQEHEAPCVSCANGWANVTRCAAARTLPRANAEKLESCIKDIATLYRRRPMSEDRVSPALACLTAE
jgi:hypothetical protein